MKNCTKQRVGEVSAFSSARCICEITHTVVVLLKELRDHGLMLRQGLLEVGERIARDAERGSLDVFSVLVEPGSGK